MPKSPPALTIGNVAEATGLSVAALRSWEDRHGFPVADRTASGHRRYSAEHVEQILEVRRDRAAGRSLEAAIARVRARNGRAETSMFAAVRRRRPDLPVHTLSKRAMTAISRSIEDECASRAERPLLIGCFEREQFYRRSELRWRELARTARRAVVFADFPRHRTRSAVIEIALGGADPLGREWAVVCDAADATACLLGVELPPDRDGRRRYESIWSVEPDVVEVAATVGIALAQRAVPSLKLEVARPSTDEVSILARAAAVTSRVVDYLDR